MKTSRAPRAAAIAIALVASTLPALSAVSAEAAPVGTVMVTTQRQSDATLASTQVGWYGKGAVLALSCYKRGQSVKGYYSPWVGNGGWDNLWYKTADGYFVADVDINTGSNNPVTGQCGVTSAPAPATPALAAQVDGFVAQYNNRFVDFDGYWGAQCVDLFNFYNQDVVKAGRVGVNYAYQLWTSAPSAKYTRVSASSTPQKGDVAVWNSNLPGSGGAGHVAIVLAQVNSTTISVFEQNVWLSAKAPHSASIVKDESKNYLLGYLRPIR